MRSQSEVLTIDLTETVLPRYRVVQSGRLLGAFEDVKAARLLFGETLVTSENTDVIALYDGGECVLRMYRDGYVLRELRD